MTASQAEAEEANLMSYQLNLQQQQEQKKVLTNVHRSREPPTVSKSDQRRQEQ